MLKFALLVTFTSALCLGQNGCESVAVCFIGITRSLRGHSYESINRNLLTPLTRQGFLYDIFVHTYNMTVINNPRSKERNVTLDATEWEMLEPLAYKIDSPRTADAEKNFEYYKKFGNPWPDDPSGSSLRNHLRALYSIEECYKLIPNPSSYTYIMFARPDVVYVRKLPDIRSLVRDNKTIGVKFLDRFAIGFPEVIRVWAFRMQAAEKYLSSKWDPRTHREHSRGLHSENLVKYVLYTSGITRKDVGGFCFIRVRGGGCFKQLDCSYCRWRCPHPCRR